jgi:hypothetical protein
MVTIQTDCQKFNAMIEAAVESIRYRQSLFEHGAIVESDPRMDNGFSYGLQNYCRTYSGYTLGRLGMTEELERLLGFYRRVQSLDGAFGTAYSAVDPVPLDKLLKSCTDQGTIEWLRDETDSTGYVLWHAAEFFRATSNKDWLSENWPWLKRAADAVVSLMDPESYGVRGTEEIILLEETGEEILNPVGYMIQINGTLARGLEAAAYLALGDGDAAGSEYYLAKAALIRRFIKSRLWNQERGRYLVGIQDDGSPYTGPMHFTILPALQCDRWTDRDAQTFQAILPKIHGRDRMIDDAYWSNDFSKAFEGWSHHQQWSGSGVYLGGYPLAIEALVLSGDAPLAGRFLHQLLELTDESNLSAEHLNTVVTGAQQREGSALYPHPSSHVDRGNFMHLTFFLRLVCKVAGLGQNVQNDLFSPLAVPGLSRITVSKAPQPSGGNADYEIEIRNGYPVTKVLSIS